MTESRILNGRYELGALIGRGGMADVHHARDIRLGREVAIKLLRRDLARDPVFQSRFRREAQAVAGLNHPAIVAVYDTGEEDLGDDAGHDVRAPFIVMEYVEGRTLRDLLRSGEVDVDSAVRYTLGVLAALDYSHRKGIVHRDIKPANVMVTADGGVKVMDFGIARALADSAATMTQTQAVVGTAQYLSPEQARGETVDARSDLYSAGCLLFELLAGHPPFTGDSPVSVAYQHVGEEAPAPSESNPDVSAALDDVVAVALRKDRNERFQDAARFAAALNAALEGRSPLQDGALTAALGIPPAATQAFSTLPDEPTAAYAAVPAPAAPASATPPSTGNDTGGPDPGRSRAGVPGPAPRRRHDDGYESSRRRAWTIVLAVAVALVLAAAGWFVWNLYLEEQARNAVVPVPPVQNMSQTEAQNALIGAGLRPLVERRFDDDVAKDLAIGTDPETNVGAPPDSEVRLFISDGSENVVLPEDLAGRSEASVRSALEELGLVVGDVVQTNSATVPFDRLVGTNPALGEQVKAGSSVSLSMSSGKVTVPPLVDLTRQEAEEALADEAVQLKLAVREVQNTVVEPGTITDQEPRADQSIEQGGTVTVTIAVAPAPPQDAEPSESEAPPSDSGDPAETGAPGNSGDAPGQTREPPAARDRP